MEPTTSLRCVLIGADSLLIECGELLRSRGHEVVGAYLADAKAGPTGPEPIHFREVFRTRGPSNYAHGKQERA